MGWPQNWLPSGPGRQRQRDGAVMATRKAPSDTSLAPLAEPLYREIRAVLESARAGAYRAVNAAMVQAYWNVGRLIVEFEQKGRRRAEYGGAVLDELSSRLSSEFGRGFTATNLRYMRQFYLTFPIHHAPRDESSALSPDLSWTHYRLLIAVDDSAAREWYAREAAEQHWSTRQLERQIGVLYYERLLASRKKAPVRKEAITRVAALEPEQFIRNGEQVAVRRQRQRHGPRAIAGEGADLDRAPRGDQLHEQRQQLALVGADLHAGMRVPARGLAQGSQRRVLVHRVLDHVAVQRVVDGQCAHEIPAPRPGGRRVPVRAAVASGEPLQAIHSRNFA